MDGRLQLRVQRYGWDRASARYEDLWREALAPATQGVLRLARLQPGERVLDVACGTGLVTFAAAELVGPRGEVLGTDLSGEMVQAAQQRAPSALDAPVRFARMDAEALDLPDGRFDVALCALGLMYLPDPARAVREMARVLRPGGRLVLAVWGERARCGWAPLFGIVDAEVASDVCPLFFGLGREGSLARLCADAGLKAVAEQRIVDTLAYADGDSACEAALAGGPVALAWSRFGPAVRERVRQRYLAAIEPWRQGAGYAVPAEFVVVAAVKGAGSQDE